MHIDKLFAGLLVALGSSYAQATILLSGSVTYADQSSIYWSTTLPDTYVPNASWNHNELIDEHLAVTASVNMVSLDETNGLYTPGPSDGNLWLTFLSPIDLLAGIMSWEWFGWRAGDQYTFDPLAYQVISASDGPLNPVFAIRHTVSISRLSTVPEPATLALMGLGVAGLGLSRRKAKSN